MILHPVLNKSTPFPSHPPFKMGDVVKHRSSNQRVIYRYTVKSLHLDGPNWLMDLWHRQIDEPNAEIDTTGARHFCSEWILAPENLHR